MTDLEAFYSRADGDRYVPGPQARSPWSPDMMHGRLLAGLAARTVEDHHQPAEFRPARITIDLFRSPPMEPVEVSHRRRRDGRRVRVVEVSLAVGGSEVAVATVVLLRTGPHPEGEIWSRSDWDVPTPERVEVPPSSAARSNTSLEIRPIDGQGMGSAGQRRIWLRELRDLVDDRPTTAFQRAAMAADMASPLGNSSTGGLAFINADITVYLGRLPIGEWVGLEVGAHVGADGIAVTRSDLFDLDGAFGFTDVCAVATPPMGR